MWTLLRLLVRATELGLLLLRRSPTYREGISVNKLDKIVEDRIKAEGWIKLLPTEKCETSQPHRFRYTDGKSDSVCIIQYGALAGVFVNFDMSYTGNITKVYPSAKWQEKYQPVDWDTPECSCEECLVTDGLEESQRFSKAAAYFARTLEGTDTQLTVNIADLQLEEADNGYKRVSFYYKIDNQANAVS
jgi:hypothetical protein